MSSPIPKPALTILGAATIMMWLSYVAYLPPFAPSPNVAELSGEAWKARELVQEKYRSQQDMEDKLNRALYVGYAKGYALAIVGALTGVLLVAKRRSGRYLALTLAALMIVSRVIAALMYSSGVVGWAKLIYGYMLRHSPLTVVHKDIVAPLFFLFTIWFLSKKSVSNCFGNGV